MILATDVHYFSEYAIAAGVLFKSWESSNIEQLITVKIDTIEPYQSGQFYKRELPCLLGLLEKIEVRLDTIIVDGFVHLDANKKAGLGKYLYDALADKVVIIGVAKNAYNDAMDDLQIYRGESKKPCI
jgi:deoxyribonuclease V